MKNVPTYAMALALAVVAFYGYLDRAKVQTLEVRLERARLAELERGFNEATHMSALDPVWGEDEGEPGARAVASTYVRRSGDTMTGPLKANAGVQLRSSQGAAAGFCVNGASQCLYYGDATEAWMNTGFRTSGPITGGNGVYSNNLIIAGSYVQAATFLRSVGVAYAALPAAAAGNKGAIEYDTTNERLMWSNGTAWAAIPNNGVLSGYTSGSLVANQEIIRARMASGAGYVTRVGATVDVAGTGAGTFTVEAYNVTAAAQICVTAAIPCASAAGGSAGSACTGAFALGDDVAVRMDQSGCTTKAELNGYLVFGGGH